MQLGVFIPIGNNGWLISTTSPQYKPSFDLNRTIVEKAERFGFDFALSMIKLHGFGGPSEFWDYNLESFTLMAGPRRGHHPHPALRYMRRADRAAADRRAHGGDDQFDFAWPVRGEHHLRLAAREYTQMGIWPGAEHYRRRYDYCAEYVTVMRELWETGRSDFKGDFFQMDDCRCLPLPTANIPIICAAQSDAGTSTPPNTPTRISAPAAAINQPTLVTASVARLVRATRRPAVIAAR